MLRQVFLRMPTRLLSRSEFRINLKMDSRALARLPFWFSVIWIMIRIRVCKLSFLFTFDRILFVCSCVGFCLNCNSNLIECYRILRSVGSKKFPSPGILYAKNTTFFFKHATLFALFSIRADGERELNEWSSRYLNLRRNFAVGESSNAVLNAIRLLRSSNITSSRQRRRRGSSKSKSWSKKNFRVTTLGALKFDHKISSLSQVVVSEGEPFLVSPPPKEP